MINTVHVTLLSSLWLRTSRPTALKRSAPRNMPGHGWEMQRWPETLFPTWSTGERQHDLIKSRAREPKPERQEQDSSGGGGGGGGRTLFGARSVADHLHWSLSHDANIIIAKGDLRGPGRKHGTLLSGWKQQLLSQIGMSDHAPGRAAPASPRRTGRWPSLRAVERSRTGSGKVEDDRPCAFKERQ